MQLKLIETTFSEGFVRMRYADNSDPKAANQWIDLCVPSADLKAPAGSSDPLGPLADRHLAVIQVAALRCAQAAIDEERKRLLNPVDRTA